MTQRLLIVGGTGFVGSHWAAHAKSRFDVFCAARSIAPTDRALAMDITDASSVRQVFDAARPDCVTLLAALADIDRCQREPHLAEAVNIAGTRNVAEACQRHEARLLFASSDAVFDGRSPPYAEDAPRRPVNEYGRCKSLAEDVVRNVLPQAAILRMSLVLGRCPRPGSNSFLEKVAGNLRAGNPIISPDYEFRNPIDIDSLLAVLLDVTLDPAATGVFHAGATDVISRYELTRELARRLGADENLVQRQTESVPGRAPRAANTWLSSTRLTERGHAMPMCAEAIDRAVGG